MTSYVLLLLLAAIGMGETAYLIHKRITRERPKCVIGAGCHQILESKYNQSFGIPNEILGFLFYISVAILAALQISTLEPIFPWSTILKLVILGGVMMSLYFIYIQWRVLKAWCFWCLTSALNIFVMAIIVVVIDFTFV